MSSPVWRDSAGYRPPNTSTQMRQTPNPSQNEIRQPSFGGVHEGRTMRIRDLDVEDPGSSAHDSLIKCEPDVLIKCEPGALNESQAQPLNAAEQAWTAIEDRAVSGLFENGNTDLASKHEEFYGRVPGSSRTPDCLQQRHAHLKQRGSSIEELDASLTTEIQQQIPKSRKGLSFTDEERI